VARRRAQQGDPSRTSRPIFPIEYRLAFAPDDDFIKPPTGHDSVTFARGPIPTLHPAALQISAESASPAFRASPDSRPTRSLQPWAGREACGKTNEKKRSSGSRNLYFTPNERFWPIRRAGNSSLSPALPVYFFPPNAQGRCDDSGTPQDHQVAARSTTSIRTQFSGARSTPLVVRRSRSSLRGR